MFIFIRNFGALLGVSKLSKFDQTVKIWVILASMIKLAPTVSTLTAVARSLSGFNRAFPPSTLVGRISNLRSGVLCAACSFRGESTQRYKIIVYIYWYDIDSVCRHGECHEFLREDDSFSREGCFAFRPKGKFPFSCSAVIRGAYDGLEKKERSQPFNPF